MNWRELFNDDNSKISTQFALSVFCALFGFLASSLGFIVFGTKLLLYPTVMVGNPPAPAVADIPPNITSLMQTFILQTIGGVAGAILYRPKPAPTPENTGPTVVSGETKT